MEVNTLAFIAVLLFLAISTAFLFILYVKTASASSGNN
nr:Chain M, Photosystem II reaction center protein M [Picea abies]8C29_m Chain m, Photosystem II reaction center protein M [Picea abies]